MRKAVEAEPVVGGQVGRSTSISIWRRLLSRFRIITPAEECTHAPKGEMCIDCAALWSMK
jgi:hypothetical protein